MSGSGVCGRCGRPLKSKESIKRGFGAVCYEKALEEKKARLDLEEIDQELDENFMDEIGRI